MKKLSTILTGLIMILFFTACSDANNRSVVLSDTTAQQPQSPDAAVGRQTNTQEAIGPTKPTSINKKVTSPFDKLDYDKVVAYDYEGGKGAGVIDIITDGKLASTVKQQKQLTSQQVNELTNLLSANTTYGGNKAACFDPHLGIVFYRHDEVVAHISICMECNYLHSSISIPATEAKKFKIDDDEYAAEGFSKSGREGINSLCKQLRFSHCADKLDSMFDE